ncbi:SRPBCC family protein [Tundrisphaera lichenicola]|uniref:SRPBCC family protein n=1 Tax=Tundrisphaera lichenicola TaxID=2029860 RepID=UPI003EB97FC3
MNATDKPGTTTFTTPTDREIVISRVFDAPRRLVWEAVTNPEHVPNWYGPRGWTLPVCTIDLRPGGAWRFVGQGPDGSRMGMSGVYREIAPPERLVTTESFDDFPGESINTLTLVESGGRTTMTVAVLYPSREVRDAVLQSGMQDGASQTYDRLAEHLQGMD